MIDHRRIARAASLAIAALVAAPALGGCVPQNKYDALLADSQSAHAQLLAGAQKEKQQDEDIAKLRQDLADAQAQMQDRDQKLSDMSTSSHNVQAQLDEATAINAKLRGELERLGKNVDAMLQEKGTLSKALEDAKTRLEELRKAQAAAEARAALFQQFVQKLKKMIDAGQLKVGTRAGRLVIQLPNDVLFDSGQTAIKPKGKEALAQLAKVLVTVPGRAFQVGGHTDNLPIQTARFPSNWELSTARAVEVVKFLIAQGVAPKALSAAGYGEFDPVAGNETPDGRAKNRRIELTLQPNLDELVAAPALDASK
ncbi:MAG TPA: OmpA family protein [Polyangiaceae bacterium]|jgi:chemotaxis protein MotB